MIDISSEQLVSFREVADLMPRNFNGKKISLSTIYRWSNRGINGVTLETIRVGGIRCTSMEALGKFIATLSASPRNPPMLSRKSRSAAVARTKKFLDDARI